METSRPTPSLQDGLISLGDADFERLRALVYERTGIALGPEKKSLLQGRLAKRLRVLGLEGYGQYLRHLEESDPDGSELAQFTNVVTTNKTDFFREDHHFRYLAEKWLPKRVEAARHGAPRRLRVWSSACSTGEEPYTIAMTLLDGLGIEASSWDVRILASDINTEVLRKASTGVYPEERIAVVPPEVRNRHFLKGTGERAGQVRVRGTTRAPVVFRQINLIEDGWPIHTKFDAIFCRNVMIYFDRPTQERLLGRFLRFLAPGGNVFLGHSECIHGWFKDLIPLGGTVYEAATDRA